MGNSSIQDWRLDRHPRKIVHACRQSPCLQLFVNGFAAGLTSKDLTEGHAKEVVLCFTDFETLLFFESILNLASNLIVVSSPKEISIYNNVYIMRVYIYIYIINIVHVFFTVLFCPKLCLKEVSNNEGANQQTRQSSLQLATARNS